MNKILVTGASGMVGEALIAALVSKGYTIHALTRKAKSNTSSVSYFTWDLEEGAIDKSCITDVEAIIHLAGAGIAKKPWSKNVRINILKSRTDSIQLIYQLLQSTPHRVKTVISASATGYYGNRGDELLTEERVPSDDFLGQTCLAWEQVVSQAASYGIRTVSLRSGIILSKEDGALPLMAKPVKLGLGAKLGNGRQYTPWIHLEDAVAMYIFALEHEGLRGVYNMVAPETITNKTLNRALAKTLKKPLWAPPVPAFLIRSIMGKMSDLLLHSTRVSAERISNAGFKFKYPTIREALTNIYIKPAEDEQKE
ncbi:TIGR01777 family protein [Olivibacter sp. SDN3]|uniref:TIGR01777 family oxidoreductase n=1 Tax=Olivibacter sp. SDN3 TaxID=2764720 RepID=UPI001651AE9A|nr:TIGR01777 family oxidoreductase [Olivibacter sp. SDN3]QNL51469.1 TIGR01777 family protein [Olivibacter sp. SDN3]